jgi:hypothetical protein
MIPDENAGAKSQRSLFRADKAGPGERSAGLALPFLNGFSSILWHPNLSEMSHYERRCGCILFAVTAGGQPGPARFGRLTCEPVAQEYRRQSTILRSPEKS